MKHKSTKYYKARCDRLFSLWIRQRDAVDGVCRCITCGTPHPWRSIHCGHFISRGKENTRYNEKNSSAQCVSCNSFREGMQYEHGKAIDRKYGEGTADSLVIKSKFSNKRSWFDFKILGDMLLDKLKGKSFVIK